MKNHLPTLSKSFLIRNKPIIKILLKIQMKVPHAANDFQTSKVYITMKAILTIK